jgi:transmembrane sensor
MRLRTQIAPPPWDELREQRVLARILEQRRGTAATSATVGTMAPGARSVSRLPRPRLVGYGMAAAALCAVLALLFVGRGRIFPSRTLATGPSVSATSAASTLALVDGSQIHLLRDAEVKVDEERPEVVRIAQNHGAVRYEVSHNPSREFTVHAAGTTVRVRGTVFTVDVRDSAVEVRVERGRVEVDDGARKHELVAGEALEVASGAAAAAAAKAAAADAAADPGSPSMELDDPPAAPGSANGSSSTSPPSSGPAAAPGRDPSPPSAASLQASADAERLSGRNAEAAVDLERLVRLYPTDPRVPNVLFTLGRVERARGNLAASARAFDRCFKAAPQGPLAEDAFAETAVSWSGARRTAEARAQASDYLTRWPAGPNAARMRDLLGP